MPIVSFTYEKAEIVALNQNWDNNARGFSNNEAYGYVMTKMGCCTVRATQLATVKHGRYSPACYYNNMLEHILRGTSA